MPKHKRTREQKIKADERNFAPTYVFSASHIKQPNISPERHDNTTTLVVKDLRKTLIVCLAIVILQILFYVILKNHVLAINFVRY